VNTYVFCKSRIISLLAIGAAINPIGPLGLVAVLSLFMVNGVVAQVVPDQTLGAEGSLINSNSDVKINGIPSTLIEGGAIRGRNLFHSFEKFNVGEERGVYFDNPVGIQRILSRVTGNGISEILGTLGVLGNADLFLINPNGIIFGPKVSLDVKGSFIATTANSLIFEDGTQFSAKGSTTLSPLTVSIPVGLQFRETPGDILQQPTSLDSEGINGQPGKTLAFVGGNVTVQRGLITIPEGRLEIGSVAETSYVSLQAIPKGWALNYGGVKNFHNIEINQGSSLLVQSGDIQVQARNLNIKDGSQIQGFEGNLKVLVSDTVEITGFTPLDNSKFIFSGLVNDAISDRDVGGIMINARRLIIQDGGRISTRSTGLISGENFTIATAKGGDLIVNASESVQLTGLSGVPTGLFSGTGSFGAGGNITINTQNLTIQDGASISAESLGINVLGQPFATGAAGNININASESLKLGGGFITTETNGLGSKAGNLTIETGQINVSDRSKVSVSGKEGQAGNLKITGNSLILNRGDITAEVGKTGAESGANITLQIRDLLRLENESLISAKATGDANGGNIDIDPTFVLIFPPTGPNGSDIIAKAERGNGGKINISAQGLFGTAQRKSSEGNRSNDIDASSEFGSSGQVQINGTVDPNQGVAQIPETVVDPNALVAQSPCKRGAQSQFTRTGRGGLPPNLSDDLSGESTQVGLVKPAPSIVAERQAQKTSSGVAPNENQTSNIENPIVPAQGWSFNDKGDVVLTAYNPAVTGPQRLKENPVGCPAL
jgi:filamentous hemagglutinin family protein